MPRRPEHPRYSPPALFKIAGIRSDSAVWFTRFARLSAEGHRWRHHQEGTIPEPAQLLLGELQEAAERFDELAQQVGNYFYVARVDGWREWSPRQRRWTRRRPRRGTA